jgi:hypothetical protein
LTGYRQISATLPATLIASASLRRVEDLVDLGAERQDELVHKYMYESADRVPLLTYGANSSPERRALKLAHL